MGVQSQTCLLCSFLALVSSSMLAMGMMMAEMEMAIATTSRISHWRLPPSRKDLFMTKDFVSTPNAANMLSQSA